jgi:prophage regulatory protein
MTYAIPTTPPASIPPPRRALRRAELRKIIPLSNTTIYQMERRGEFPKRFYLTSRCVVWDSDEVYAWLDARKQPEQQTRMGRAPVPNVLLRRRRRLKSSL